MVVSDDLVRNPEGVLRAVCARLGLPFQEAMLSWPAGPKPYDGVWAPYWYENTWKGTGGCVCGPAARAGGAWSSSTGAARCGRCGHDLKSHGPGARQLACTPAPPCSPCPPGFEMSVRQGFEPLQEHLKPLLGECYPAWEYLRRHAVQPLAAEAVPRPLGPAGSEQAAQAQQQGSGDAGSSGSGKEKVRRRLRPQQGGMLLPQLLGCAWGPACAACLCCLPWHVAPGLAPRPGPARCRPPAPRPQVGTHVYLPDERNANVLVGIRDGVLDTFELVGPRSAGRRC